MELCLLLEKKAENTYFLSSSNLPASRTSAPQTHYLEVHTKLSRTTPRIWIFHCNILFQNAFPAHVTEHSTTNNKEILVSHITESWDQGYCTTGLLAAQNHWGSRSLPSSCYASSCLASSLSPSHSTEMIGEILGSFFTPTQKTADCPVSHCLCSEKNCFPTAILLDSLCFSGQSQVKHPPLLNQAPERGGVPS